MPRYDYRCEDGACETDTFEVSKSYSDDSVTECPVCGTAARKLLSPIAVHFKGSGFYSTDNRGASGATGDSDKPDTKDDSKSDPKSESKPDSRSGSDSGSSPKTESKSESKTGSSSKASDSKSGSSKTGSGSKSGAAASKTS